MRVSVWTLATLIVIGVIIATLMANAGSNQNFFNTVTKVWKWAINSMMGGNE